MQEKLFNKGDVIFNKGETGDTFYRVIAGSVEIVDDGKQLVVLKEGQYFGEMAILEAYPRSATAIALEDGTKLEEISESDAKNYFSEEPEKVLGFFCHLSDRLRALTNDYNAAVNALENISGKEGQPRDKGLFDKLGKARRRSAASSAAVRKTRSARRPGSSSNRRTLPRALPSMWRSMLPAP